MVLKNKQYYSMIGIFLAASWVGCRSTSPQPVRTLKAATPVPNAEQTKSATVNPYAAVHLQQGTVSCFDAKTQNQENEFLTCEPSAVLLAAEGLIVASDKKTEGELLSPVFQIQLTNGVPQSRARYIREPLFQQTRKIEDMCSGVKGEYNFATSAFDRFREDKASWDRFNTLLYWPKGQLEAVQIANPSVRDGVTSSLSLRASIAQAMESEPNQTSPVPYFKVEGLAALPDNRLIFGIRERGKSFKDFTYTVTLVEATYVVNAGVIQVNPEMRMIYRFEPGAREELPNETGLSSLYYDIDKENLYLLTSFETADQPDALGAFLWVLSLKELESREAPHLVMDATGHKPLFFPHKAEAISMVDEQRMVVFHDDDRVTRTQEVSDAQPGSRPRELHEGVWSLIEIQ